MPSASIVIGELVQGSESPSLFTANTLQEKVNNVLYHCMKEVFICKVQNISAALEYLKV